MSRNRSGSCSSRVAIIDDANDADVDLFDIEEGGHSNSDDTIATLGNGDDAGTASIANHLTSEDDDTLAEEENDLLAVRTGRTESNRNDSAEAFLLAREAVVRFVQDSIANAVDRQKRNADKYGRANVLSFNVNDLVLLSTVNLPKHVVTNVGSSKLLPKYIGPFRVLQRRGNAYTIELPRRMRTHPTFYVGRLRPYCQYAVSSAGECNRPAQESLRDSCGHEPDSQVESGVTRSRDELTTARHEGNDVPARSPTESVRTPIGHPTDQCEGVAPSVPTSDVHLARDRGGHLSRGGRGHVVRPPIPGPTSESDQVFPPPPQPLVDSHGGQRFHVERILNHRDVKGQRTSYLVRWREYPPSHDSWERGSQLILDVEGLVHQYDKTHPMNKKVHRKTRAHGACRAIAN